MPRPPDLRRCARLIGIVGVAALLTSCTEPATGDEAAFCERIVAVPVPADLDALRTPTPELATAPLIEALKDAETVAPVDVKSDVTAMIGAVEVLRDTLVERDTDEPTGAESLLTERLDEFGQASDRVVSYTRTTCGIDLEAS